MLTLARSSLICSPPVASIQIGRSIHSPVRSARRLIVIISMQTKICSHSRFSCRYFFRSCRGVCCVESFDVVRVSRPACMHRHPLLCVVFFRPTPILNLSPTCRAINTSLFYHMSFTSAQGMIVMFADGGSPLLQTYLATRPRLQGRLKKRTERAGGG